MSTTKVLNSKIFPSRLKMLRGNASQSVMAKKFGVSQVAYGRWELGKAEPKYDVLVAISKYFSVSLDWLLGLTDTRTGAGPVVTATGGSAASGTGPATVHAPPAVAPPGPAETDRLLTIIESQQRVIENLSKLQK